MGQCGTKIPKEHKPVDITPNTNCCILPTLPISAKKTSQHIISINNDHNVNTVNHQSSNYQEPISIFNNHINNDNICHKAHAHNDHIIQSPMSISMSFNEDECKYDNVQQCVNEGRTQSLDSSPSSSSSSFGFESIKKLNRYNPDHNMHGLNTLDIDDENENDAKEPDIKRIDDAVDADGHEQHEQHLQHILNEPLIECRFNRTLFCEDITYEYIMKCQLNGCDTKEWIARLTLENMTKFYRDTLEKWRRNTAENLIPTQIPCQFGKVMTPKVFSSLINNVLQQPVILKDVICGEKTANFLSIPYDLRSIVQYNPDSYIYGINVDLFRYFGVICENAEKYKYLCHSTAVYKQDYEYDDCCECYDEPQITNYSYWIRSLHHNKIDFLINCTSNNIFSILMNDAAFNIADTLINNVGFDENSAWIITDYLPKYLLFNHQDSRCNSKVIYKYDPRQIYQSDADLYSEPDPEEDCFFVDDEQDEILQRHGINRNDLKLFCKSMRIQHTSIACIPEMSPSVSEYIESISRSTEHPSDHITELTSANNPCLLEIPSAAYSAHNMSDTVTPCPSGPDYDGNGFHGNDESEDDDDDEKYQLFFSTFIDEEGEDDITMYQWLLSVQKLGTHLTEKQIVAAFKYMLQQNEDNEGYIDFVDFTNFCRAKIDDDDAKRTQHQINHFMARSNNI